MPTSKHDTAKPKICVAIITGTQETSLHPVPPVADGAPQWNVFRLTEAAADNPSCELDIHVISPCEHSHLKALQDYPVKASGRYHHVVFSGMQVAAYRKYLRNCLPLQVLLHPWRNCLI